MKTAASIPFREETGSHLQMSIASFLTFLFSSLLFAEYEPAGLMASVTAVYPTLNSSPISLLLNTPR